MNGLTNSRKVAFVTGGTHGIGKATAETLLRDNWEVYICGSNPSDNRGHLMDDRYENLHYRLADVSDEGAVKAVMDEIFEKHGRLDLAFNNAGRGCEPRPLHMADFSDFYNVVRTNLIGTAICMKNEIEIMLKQEYNGIIINSASVSAYKAKTGADSSYAASKAGVASITREAAACALYRDKILFYLIVPGYIETRMTSQDDKTVWAKRLPEGRACKPQEVADVVARVAQAPVFGSGQVFYVDGGDFLI